MWMLLGFLEGMFMIAVCKLVEYEKYALASWLCLLFISIQFKVVMLHARSLKNEKDSG